MPYYRECPVCHCNLDPGEACDCQEQEQEATDNNEKEAKSA